jgi:lipoyl(octanoyl) transferase
MSGLKIQWLGRVPYAAALEMQHAFVELKAEDTNAADHLLLLEHDPIYTTGRGTEVEALGALPHQVLQTNRGGKVTFHGPGQLVGYPVLDLRRRGQDLHRYLRNLEEGLIRLSAMFGVQATAREGLTGVWVGPRKLASLGVGVRRWITMHGFALNVCGPLDGFDHITPCGLEGVEMTSLEREGANGCSVEAVAALAQEIFADI